MSPTPKKSRSDNIEMERRLLIIQAWLVELHTSQAIKKQIIQNGWSLSERHAARLLAKAKTKWLDEEDEELKQVRKRRVAQIENTIRSLKDQYKGTPEGIRAITGAHKLIKELEGTAAPTKIEVSGNGGAPIQQNITCEVVFKDYGPQQ